MSVGDDSGGKLFFKIYFLDERESAQLNIAPFVFFKVNAIRVYVTVNDVVPMDISDSLD